jgi:hypothetical protein
MHHKTMLIKGYFKGSRLAKMSDGSYCIIRELGLVPGGKGMKYYENLLRLSAKGVTSKIVELIGHFAKRINDNDIREMSNEQVTAAFESDRTGVGGVARHGASSR